MNIESPFQTYRLMTRTVFEFLPSIFLPNIESFCKAFGPSTILFEFELIVARMKSGRSHDTGYDTRQRLNCLGSSMGIEGKKIEPRIRKRLGCFASAN
jgi:hypothetical protein